MFESLSSLGLTLLLLIAALLSVRRDYRSSGQKLSSPTVALVWGAYLVHAGVTIWFALEAPWHRFAIDTTFAHLSGAFVVGFGTAILFDGIATFASLERISGIEVDELVIEGIYRYSRNPQNLGWGLALLGVAVAGRSPLAVLSVAVFAAVIHLYLVWLEEPHLDDLFGEKYHEYRKRTPRYFGRPE